MSVRRLNLEKTTVRSIKLPLWLDNQLGRRARAEMAQTGERVTRSTLMRRAIEWYFAQVPEDTIFEDAPKED